MSVLSWLGRRVKLTDASFWSLFLASESWAGKTVTAETALQVAAAWACIRLKAETHGTIPCMVFERKGDRREAAPTHWLYALLHDQPAAGVTAVEFWEGISAALDLWGNGYARKEWDSAKRERLVALTPCNPQGMQVTRDKNGARVYRYSWQGETWEVGEVDVFHVRGFGIGGELGLSPIAFARQTLGSAMATDEAAARTFANGMRPGGYFEMNQILTKEQRAQVRAAIIDPLTGSENAGKAILLEAGMKFQQMQMNHEDAQMLQSRGFNVEEVCRIFGVPPILIGHASAGQTMWGTGVEQIFGGYTRLSVRPRCKRIEAAIQMQLLSPGERIRFFVEFNLEALLRGDSAARAAFLKVMTESAIYTHNEARAYENLPPMPGGDVLTIQGQYVPLDRIGKTPQRRAEDSPPQNDNEVAA